MQQQETTTQIKTTEQQLFQNQQAVPQNNVQPALQEQPVLYQNQHGISSQKFQPIFQKSQQDLSQNQQQEITQQQQNFRHELLYYLDIKL